MTRPVVAVLDAFADVGDIAALLPGCEVRDFAAVPGVAGIVAVLAGPETPIAAADLAAMPDLQILAVTSTGHDHVPVEAAAARGVWVTNSAGYCTDEVAETALALGLNLLRGVSALDRRVRRGEWDVTEVAPRRVTGTRWGLVGAGRIAQALADRLRPLGVQVFAWDPEGVPAEIVAARSLEELLAGCDIISLHAPLTVATAGLIGADELATMPRESFLVNVARGELVDPTALRAALVDGQLAGAALDVFAVEPLPLDDPLRDAPNLLMSPHAAWYSSQAKSLPFRWAAEAVADVLAGRRPQRVVAAPRTAGSQVSEVGA